jgi:hypothetical protein
MMEIMINNMIITAMKQVMKMMIKLKKKETKIMKMMIKRMMIITTMNEVMKIMVKNKKTKKNLDDDD